MAEKRALMMMRVDPPGDKEAEWNATYGQNITKRLGVPGFISGRRFVAIDGRPKYLTLYDLEKVSVLASDAYLNLGGWGKGQGTASFGADTAKFANFSRGLYEQIYPVEGNYQPPKSEIVYIEGHDVPPDREKEFNTRYNTEHLPAMLRIPGFLTARRFVVFTGKLPPQAGMWGAESKYVAVYDVASEKALKSPEFTREQGSPWSSWMRGCCTEKVRGSYRRIFPKP